jgi:hypothetical protein
MEYILQMSVCGYVGAALVFSLAESNAGNAVLPPCNPL